MTTANNTNPIPEFKHVFFCHSEFGNLLSVCGQSNEMFGDMSRVFGVVQEPLASGPRVGDGFLRSECFRSNDEQRRFRIQLLHRLRQVSSVCSADV